MPAAHGPLAGIRVLDMATPRGEFAGRFLADLGAEVVKVEPPAGAAARSMPPLIQAATGGPRSLFWESAGLNKRSAVVDIATPEGREQVRALASAADVLIESSDPGEMESLGLGYDTLSGLNSRLIYVSVTPFGQSGPKASHPATDLTLQAAGGLVSLQGDWDRPPVPIGEPYTAAYHAGAQAAADTIIALNERQRSGAGQRLDVSMQAAIIWILMNATGYPPNEGTDPPGFGDERGQRPPSGGAAVLARSGITVHIPGLWECADGYICAVIIPSEQRAENFLNLLRWAQEAGALAGNEDLLDVCWATFLVDVQEGRLSQDLLQRAVDSIRELFLRVTKRELMERSIRDNLFFAPIYNAADLLEDPQLAGRGFWQDVEGVTHPGHFARLSATPLVTPSPAPGLGQHQSLADAPRDAAPPASVLMQGGLRPRPFEGLKVADFAWIGVGPLIAKALADHGATVVHVESQTRIDSLRMAAPFKGGVQDPDLSQFFANFNSSKLGLALKLTAPEGNRVARRLIDWADVVVESFTPGTMAKLGLDYATVARERTDLVMLSTCLRGQTGPEAPLAGFGQSGAALSGLHAVTGWPDRAPVGPWGAYTDFITPRLGVAALASALYHRALTGQGQHLDVSQVECGINFLGPEMLRYTITGEVAPPAGHDSPTACPNGVYQAAGMARFVAVSVETAGQWRALRDLALGDRFADPQLDDIEQRRQRSGEIDEAIRAWLLPQDAATAVERLVSAGVPASLVARPSDLHRDEQLKHRGFFTELVHTRMGATPYDGFVTRFSAIPSGPRAAAPCLGEHTDHVLAELLGLGDDEVRALRASGVLS